jgi:hypothetical protein
MRFLTTLALATTMSLAIFASALPVKVVPECGIFGQFCAEPATRYVPAPKPDGCGALGGNCSPEKRIVNPETN